MDLPEYIEKTGVKEFARRFGVTERAALAYKYRSRLPRPEVSRRIVADSPVSWDGIYGATEKNRA